MPKNIEINTELLISRLSIDSESEQDVNKKADNKKAVIVKNRIFDLKIRCLKNEVLIMY